MPSYRAELDRRFNNYLLAKYGSRKALDNAPKEDGTRCLLEDEDPEKGTVRRLAHLEGTQMYVDWEADYRGMESPARYADYTEFLTKLQFDFSREMRDHLLSIGVKCPISISDHAQGAALKDAGHGPVSIDSLEGDMMVDRGATVYPLNPDGSRMKPLEGKYGIHFAGEGTMFFEIVANS